MKIGFTVLLTDYTGGEAPRYEAIKDMAQRSSGGSLLALQNHSTSSSAC